MYMNYILTFTLITYDIYKKNDIHKYFLEAEKDSRF